MAVGTTTLYYCMSKHIDIWGSSKVRTDSGGQKFLAGVIYQTMRTSANLASPSSQTFNDDRLLVVVQYISVCMIIS